MDENEVTPICILVAKEDVTCNNIIATMLRDCKHRVLRTGGILDVMHAIWEEKDRPGFVLTNANRLGLCGQEIIEHIDKTLHLRVLSISVDKKNLESRDQTFNFEAFILNGLSRNDVNKLFQIALGKERSKMEAARQKENVKRASVSNISVEINKTSSDATHSKRKREAVDVSEDTSEDNPTTKKHRVAWTPERHNKFLEAIESLGIENAVPKRIVEYMKDPELTRENVASHLQKHRLSLKRSQEFSVPVGTSTRNDFQGLSVQPSSFGSHYGRSWFTGRNGLEKMHVDELRIAPNYGIIIEDQKRNMLVSIDNHVPSSKFVGIRVTNDGKCVGYGNAEAPNTINTESFASTSLQGPSLLSPPGQNIGDEYPFNLDLSIPQSFAMDHRVMIGDSGNEEDTEKSCHFGDQDTSMQLWEEPATLPFPFPSETDAEKSCHFGDQDNRMQFLEEPATGPFSPEMDILVKNESATSSVFHHVEDFSLPMPTAPWNYMSGISEDYSLSPLPQTYRHIDECFEKVGLDYTFPEETGSTSHYLEYASFCHDD